MLPRPILKKKFEKRKSTKTIKQNYGIMIFMIFWVGNIKKTIIINKLPSYHFF